MPSPHFNCLLQPFPSLFLDFRIAAPIVHPCSQTASRDTDLHGNYWHCMDLIVNGAPSIPCSYPSSSNIHPAAESLKESKVSHLCPSTVLLNGAQDPLWPAHSRQQCQFIIIIDLRYDYHCVHWEPTQPSCSSKLYIYHVCIATHVPLVRASTIDFLFPTKRRCLVEPFSGQSTPAL